MDWIVCYLYTLLTYWLKTYWVRGVCYSYKWKWTPLSFKRLLSIKRHRSSRLRAVSLFPCSVKQNARDTLLTTRVTEVTRRERRPRFSHLAASALALPCLNLTEKRDCSQSTAIGSLFPSRSVTVTQCSPRSCPGPSGCEGRRLLLGIETLNRRTGRLLDH